MRMSKTLIAMLAFGALSVSSTLASAATVFSWSEATYGSSVTSGTLSIDRISPDPGAGKYAYSMRLSNTSNDSSVLTRFLLQVDPEFASISSITTTSSFEAKTESDGGYATTFDFCFGSDSSGSCQGGNANGGIQPGQFVDIDIVFWASAPLTFTAAGARFQRVTDANGGTDGSLKLTDTCSVNCNGNPGGGVTPPPVIPLPAGLPLLLSAFGLGGLLKLRRRKSA
ncbi:hypothetical protein [Shimia aestuarii]|uniref:VPLPA-CTERM protein sorting domain-containing protein n=1 Tax=Shimia aestuarii TaxID=254406 RepID=A0A1I4IRG2_9RHOB|nr:hypothetical protein [Shimia aestuarii]SFL56336.1 hypothetical protein SAMN04488042_101693 [Shimia aestuarii]